MGEFKVYVLAEDVVGFNVHQFECLFACKDQSAIRREREKTVQHSRLLIRGFC